jgi:hypothetical protein
VRSIEPLGLNDLRDGEFPQPQCLRLAWAAQASLGKGLSREQRDDIRTGLGERADAHDLECHIRDASPEEVREAVFSFDRDVPSHFVVDILIEGQSWKRFTRDPAARVGTESTSLREDR